MENIDKADEIEKLKREIQRLNSHIEKMENDLKDTSEKLEKTNNILSRIVDGTDDIVFTLDKKYRYTFFNNSHREVMKKIYGVEIETGRNMFEFMLNMEDAVKAKENIDRALRGESIKQSEYSGNKELDYIYFEVSHFPLMDANGNVDGAAVIARDLTKRQKMEQKLLEAKDTAEKEAAAKTIFLTNMSHEIRTPLNGIIAIVDVLKQSEMDEEQLKNIESIEKSSENLLYVINEVLDYSKLESNKTQIIKEPFSIRESFEKLKNLFAVSVKENIKIAFFTSCHFPELIEMDKIKLENILINLIGNAIKFTDNGEIVIYAKVVEQNGANIKIAISVKDTGIGIPSSKIEELFTSFMQVDETVSRKYGGTGLGLAISKGLAKIIGGEIKVKSEEGVGSEFTIDFEAKICKQNSFAVNKLKSVVFCMENNLICRTVLEIVGETGVEISEAYDGEELEPLIQYYRNKNEKFGVVIEEKQVDIPAMKKIIKIAETDKNMQLFIMQNEKEKQCSLKSKSVFYIDSILTQDVLRKIVSGAYREEMMYSCKVEEETKEKIDKIEKSINILAVEDNEINAMAIVKMLKILNTKVKMITSAIEAVKYYKENRIDLIITDIQLPDISGFEFCSMIRKIDKERGEYTPIIAVTAHSYLGYREKCLEAGMDEYLSKPFKLKELREIIMKFVNVSETDSKKITQKVEDFDKNNEIAKKTFPKLIEQYDASMKNMKRALLYKDFENIKREAHKLKGSFFVAGESEIAEKFELMEKDTKNISAELLESINILVNMLKK